MEHFKIPIVLFFFKRKEKTLRIVERISQVNPLKLYLISDGPRNDQELEDVVECRRKVEEAITWPCKVIKNYADVNKGVYDRIGLGAKWVFTMEDRAIFLEDDNLPDTTFFPYCADLLEKYNKDTRVLWICGTNYLSKYYPADGSSYMFTKHLLPCGWASWSDKFTKFYEGEVPICDDKYLMNRVKKEFENRALAFHQMTAVVGERKRILNNERPISWDYQMSFAIRANGLLGISPCVNLIENIGVDECSVHGGTTFNNIMTKRFCGIKTHDIQLPLKHPRLVLTDLEYEERIRKVMTYPLLIRLRIYAAFYLRKILGLSEDTIFWDGLKKKFSLGRRFKLGRSLRVL
jgi:hypothetical protein